MSITYSPPGVTVQTLGAQTLLTSGPSPTTILMLGTAPTGPDYPVLVDPATAVNLFGNPADVKTVGYTLPLAMFFANAQSQPSGTGPIQFLVCRAGVTRATVNIKDQAASKNAIQLAAIGAYAGSKGNNLTVTVTLNGSAVSSITIYDSTVPSSPVQLQAFYATQYDLSSNQAIANAINGANPLNNPNSVVRASVPDNTAGLLGAASGLAWGSNGGVTVTAGSGDGKGCAYNDSSIATLLAQSMWAHADYVWAGWDAGQVGSSSSALASHITNAVAANDFRKVILGPVMGTSYDTLSGGSYPVQSSTRFACVGHDAARAINPITGLLSAYDGYYLAAAIAGLKACGNPAETCDGFTVNGFVDLVQPTRNSGANTPLTTAEKNLLASPSPTSGGFLVLDTNTNGSGLTVRDFLSTAVYQSNGAINPFSQFSIQDIDDNVSEVVIAAVLPFKGRPAPSVNALQAQIQTAVTLALNSLVSKGIINGINSVSVTFDTSTLIPTVNLSYVTRYPILHINIVTSFSFS